MWILTHRFYLDDTGGVVSFISRSARHPDQIMGMRSRVVNSKRTDLSKGIRAKIESDALRIKTGRWDG